MKTRNLFFIAALAMCFVACQEKEDPSTPDYQELTFSATAATVQGVDVKFNTGDAISVFDGKANQKFTAASATSFTGTANAKAESFAAVYPYNAGYKRTAGKVTVTVPSSQTAVAGGLDPAGNFQVAYAAKTTDPLNFSFMPAVVKINVEAGDAEIVSVQISADGGETLSGACALDLSQAPKCEKSGEGSNKVNLGGTNLNGTYYVSVVPGTVSAFTVSFTDTQDSRAEVKVAGKELKSGEVADLGTFNSFNWVEAVNPNPTEVVGAVIARASFETADFNLVSDGGFEDFPYSTWKWADPDFPTYSIIDGHNSPKAIRLERTHVDGLMSNMEQACKWQKGTDGDTWWVMEFDARVSAGSCQDFYSGFGFFDQFGNWWKEVNGWPPTPEDVVENGRHWFNDEQWHHYKLEETCYIGQYKGTVHVGMWGNPNDWPCWSEYDNIVAYPKGYDITGKSTALKSSTVLGKITNATFNQVEGLRKVVAWMDQNDKVKLAFSDAVIDGVVVPTAIAETESADPSNIQITKFYKDKGVISEIVPLGEGEIAIVPDDVFILNGKTYLHYFGMTAYDPAFTLNWQADKTGFAVSEDNGKTWAAAEKFWAASAWANNADGKFSNAAFANHDGYTYMIGSHAGRDNWLWGQSYAARVADGADITDPDAYDYWTNPGWSDKGGEWTLNETCPVLQGDRGTYDLIWNPVFEVYQLFYRADDAHAILYRDSKGPDADGNWYWSGAKLLCKDEDTGVLGSISVVKIEDDGSIIFVGSQIL